MRKNLTGKQSFLLLWFGQFVSILGSSMTSFALLIWAYQNYGTAMSVATLGFVYLTPIIVFSPLAGIVVDRVDTKKILLFTDICSALSTLVVLVLLSTGNISFWVLCLMELISGIMAAFQDPAQQLAVTMIVPKDYYVRASGLRSFSSYASKILAPVFAGALIAWVGIKGVMLVDLLTFLFAALTLLIFITIPARKKKVAEEEESKGNVIAAFKFGFGYIYQRKGLFWLLLFFVAINLIASITYFSILPAMILARTNNNQVILGFVQAALGIGGVAGSVIVTALSKWSKGSKVLVIIAATCGSFFLGDILMAMSKNVVFWCSAAFLSSVFLPAIMANEHAIWQSKVDPEVQGRVFSIKNTMQWASMPMGYLIGGLLADKLFEPAMRAEGLVQNLFKGIVGTGTGSGMSLMFLFTGVIGAALCVFAYYNDDVRNLETRLADHTYVPENF